jgi:hypothetical protein
MCSYVSMVLKPFSQEEQGWVWLRQNQEFRSGYISLFFDSSILCGWERILEVHWLEFDTFKWSVSPPTQEYVHIFVFLNIILRL